MASIVIGHWSLVVEGLATRSVETWFTLRTINYQLSTIHGFWRASLDTRRFHRYEFLMGFLDGLGEQF
jgi:hypothetical protein